MSAARTHYELLGLEGFADHAAIKAAFRREIARYHPDKVVHLGDEFQELAVRRTAELTAAYKTLIDESLRRQYDASMGRDPGLFAGREPGGAVITENGSGTGSSRFVEERADGDGIVHRAVITRVRNAVTDLYGEVSTPWVRGFDLVMVPRTSPPLLRSPFPRVFVRLRQAVDAAQMAEACADAVRARLHVPRSPINVLLFGKCLNDESQIRHACESLRQPRNDAPEKTFIVVFDASDWRALFPRDAPAPLLKFIERLRA